MSVSPLTTDIALAPADPSRTASASSAFATTAAAYGARVREVTRRGRSRWTSAIGGGGSVENVTPSAGRLTAPARKPPDAHSATCTAQSHRPGSPNSRVPSSGSMIHTRSLIEPPRILQTLLGEHGVVGADPGQLVGQEALAGGVAAVHHLPRVGTAADQVLTHGEQPAAGFVGQPGRQRGVRLRLRRSDGGFGRHRPQEATVRPMQPADGPPTDHRGSRRLGPVEQWVWYLVAGVSYVGLGIYHKWLLNWFVGPAWLVAVVVIGPWLTDQVWARLRPGGDIRPPVTIEDRRELGRPPVRDLRRPSPSPEEDAREGQLLGDLPRRLHARLPVQVLGLRDHDRRDALRVRRAAPVAPRVAGDGAHPHALPGRAVAAGFWLWKRNRAFTVGYLLGFAAHVLTDVNDSVGTMLLFPFMTINWTVQTWAYAATVEGGKYLDAAAYYSSLGLVMDVFWLVVVLLSWRVLTREYWRTQIVPADPRVVGVVRPLLARTWAARPVPVDLLLWGVPDDRLGDLGPSRRRARDRRGATGRVPVRLLMDRAVVADRPVPAPRQPVDRRAGDAGAARRWSTGW